MMTEDVAIVGLACRFPDASSPAELWENVLSQRRSFRRVPPSRLRARDYFAADRSTPDAVYSWWAAVLEDYEFDRLRFRISGSTFRATDLVHWLALDVASAALDDAGFADGNCLPRESTGVVVGNTLTGEFSRANLLRLRWPYVGRVVGAELKKAGLDRDRISQLLEAVERRYKAPFEPVGQDTLAGSLSNTIAGRICNMFDFRGGAYTVDGACASSVLAVSAVCSHLVAGDLDVGLAGGVDLSLDPFELVGFAKTDALAATEMRVYDRRSEGFWPGEGCGFAVLMRTRDALASHRKVYARIVGWGVSSDGSGGLTRPSAGGQKLALERAYQRSGLEVDAVAYIEGHGTGTPVGDGVELQALGEFRLHAGATFPAVVGSVKANIGHTKAAAGIAGLIKTAMALRTRTLPPNTACDQPHRALSEGWLKVLEEAEPWPIGRPAAGVSGMGFGGVNGHLLLETADVAGPPNTGVDDATRTLVRTAQDTELFLLSGTDAGSLVAMARRLRARAVEASWGELRDLAGAVAKICRPATWRLGLVAGTPDDLTGAIDKAIDKLHRGVSFTVDSACGVFLGSGSQIGRVGLLFPGQGVPVSYDGGAWRRRFPLVAQLYRDCALAPGGAGAGTELVQPAVATAALAGLALLNALGIKACLAVGHSLGELCAYHWASALDANGLLEVVRERGRILAERTDSDAAMASIGSDADAVGDLLVGTKAVIAAFNASTQVVVAGLEPDVVQVMGRAREIGIAADRLAVTRAFHSPNMVAAAPYFAASMAETRFCRPCRPVVSTVTGQPLDPDDDLRQLLVRQLTEPVRFHEAISRAVQGADLFIEVGPGDVLSRLVHERAPGVSLDVGGPSLRGLLCSAAAAHAVGQPVRADVLFADRVIKPIDIDRPRVFLANPCEQAPDDHAGSRPLRTTTQAGPPPCAEPAHVSVGQFVRDLVARRAELPSSAIHDDDRLLDDLHMSSVTVGQIAQEAMAAAGLPPAVAPTAFANATVRELCDALLELAELGGERTTSGFDGVAPWVRAFRFGSRERRRPSADGSRASGSWSVLGPESEGLAAELRSGLPRMSGRTGVAVCLSRRREARDVENLVAGARRAISDQATEVFMVVQRGGGGSAFARSLALEHPRIDVCVVDLDDGFDDREAARAVAAEAEVVEGFTEVLLSGDGKRSVPVLRLIPPARQPHLPTLGPEDVVLVVGGAKGIAAECALAIGQATGARLALLGRARPGEDTLVDATIARLASAGLKASYAAGDVVDPAATTAAVRTLTSRFGPITAVLHAAGVNTPRLVTSVDPSRAMATLSPKVQGLRNVLAATDGDHLGLLVAFGSLIARTGMEGQAEYGLANEWLALGVEAFSKAHPRCRCLTLEWSAWSGAGMVERLGALEHLARHGVQAMPTAHAVDVMLDVLSQSDLCGRIVITGRFGPAKALSVERAHLPLLRFLEQSRVHYPSVELIVDAMVSADTDPYLGDHVMDGNSILPAALILEAMAQAAVGITGSKEPLHFAEVSFGHPVIVPASETVAIRVAALVVESGVELVIRTSASDFLVDHVRARCTFGPVDPQATMSLANRSGAAGAAEGVDPDRDLYARLLFQSGRFCRVRRYLVLTATRCVAEVEAGPERWFSAFLPSTLLLGDPGLRDAALHCVQACIPQRTVLPVAVASVDIVRQSSSGMRLVIAEERIRLGDDAFIFDIEIQDHDGSLCERWAGVEFRTAAGIRRPQEIPDALVGVALERRAQDLLGESDLKLVLDAAETNAERGNSRASFRRLLGNDAEVRHLADGRPETDDAFVSASHAAGLTLVATSGRTVACDLESSRDRSAREWATILGPVRWQLAWTIASRAGAAPEGGAAIVWAAGECLVKAGLPADCALSLRSLLPDGWVLLAGGDHNIAATLLVGGTKRPEMAIAVLSEGARP